MSESAVAGPFAMCPTEGAMTGDSEAENIENLDAKIVSTSNTLDEEPFLPVRSIITLFRIQARARAPARGEPWYPCQPWVRRLSG